MTSPEDKPVFRLTWRQAALVWSMAAALVGIWWSLQRASFQQARQLDAVSAEISVLARTYDRLEKRYENDTLSKYTVSDAARDQALSNARFTEHERRLMILEDRRQAVLRK